MTRPYIVESGNGRLIFNEFDGKGSITIDVKGSGYTIMLDRTHLVAVAAALMQCAKRLK